MPCGPLLCHHRGFLHALTEIPRREGFPMGFFSGLWPTVAKGALNNCIRFGLYNESTTVVRKSRGDAPDKPLGPGMTFTLGAAAGAVSAVSDRQVIFYIARFCNLCFAFRLSSFNPCAKYSQITMFWRYFEPSYLVLRGTYA